MGELIQFPVEPLDPLDAIIADCDLLIRALSLPRAEGIALLRAVPFHDYDDDDSCVIGGEKRGK